MQPHDVLDFWFNQHGMEDWFGAGDAFDKKCAATLSGVYAQAIKGELWTWRTEPSGRLAEIILLDQLSRQLNRGDARAFAYDGMALALAQECVSQGLDKDMSNVQKLFLYLPYQHSESLNIQQQSLKLHADLPDFQKFAQEHHGIIARFGRFPLRNAALGRTNTPEEEAYIASRDGQMY